MATVESRSVPLSKEKLAEVTANVKDFAWCQGLAMRTLDHPFSSDILTYYPFTLLPSFVPRECFEEAVDVQIPYNLLVHKVAQDYDFLYESLRGVMQTDDYIRRLWNILTTVRDEGTGQPINLIICRSDYMLDVKEPHSLPQIMQTEINTFASGAACVAAKLTDVHRYALDLMGCSGHDPKLPHNQGLVGLAEGFVSAWNFYNNPSAAILFMIEDGLDNVFDQRWLEFHVHAINRTIRVMQMTFLEVYQKAILTTDRRLVVGGVEVGLVYYRSGYKPEHYTSSNGWEVRLMMERSLAIKCPNVQVQLAGSKKIQEVLARPGVLEMFLDDKETVRKLRKTFAGLYTLDMNPEGDQTAQMALKNPHRFVMKPQREGGGNNLFNDEIAKTLNRIGNTQEREEYILMEKIFPTIQKNYLLRPGADVILSDVTNEIGIFGLLIGDEKKVYENRQCGHLLRAKLAHTDEGGMMIGTGFLDTPYLIN